MIGVDTNVLVRFFVRDDPRQGSLADRFMNERTSDDPAFISVIVVAEFVWALEQVYDYQRSQIRAALALLLGSANVVLEREELVKTALMSAGEANSDIADSLIAALANDAGASATVTFDRDAAKLVPGMELLK
jgi:predicted nucleic-acid-binding protein